MKKTADCKLSSTSLADRLRERIADGTWAPGTQLRQELIAKEFGTSHIPVREAFVQLQASGFVTIVPNRGAFVSAMTTAEAAELTEMRVALELLALNSAIDFFGPNDEAAARAILQRDEKAREIEHWSVDNWAFHRVIYQASGKSHLMETLETIWRKTDRYLRLVWQLERYQDISSAQHREILDAVVARDRRAAKRLTKAHIESAGTVMQDALREARATTWIRVHDQRERDAIHAGRLDLSAIEPSEHVGSELGHVAVSIGLASWTPDNVGDTESIIKEADEALYYAKATGRNKTVSVQDIAAASTPSEPVGLT